MARHKQQGTDVELQIAPMLDMAFQLLAFFVMTFRPPAAEGQVGVNLPLTKRAPVTSAAHGKTDANATEMIEYTEQVWVKVYADQEGGVGRVTVGDDQMNGVDALAAKLRTLGTDEITLQFDAGTKYEALMHVVDLCTRAKITKINFADPLT